jgi:hypothetical protein
MSGRGFFCVAVFLMAAVADVGAQGVDVRSLGAVADGRTDATDAIQAALDGGKREIFFPVGKYLVGTIRVPTGARLRFESGARIEANPAKLVPELGEAKSDDARPQTVALPIFHVDGDDVRIEGLWFDFASGATEKIPTPVDTLVYARDIENLVVSGAYAQTTYDRELIPLAERKRYESVWRRAPTAPKEQFKNSTTLLRVDECRDVTLENSGATFIDHMIEAFGCANVTVRGNWMISGLTITTFSQGGERLHHYDNWSRDVGYQAVWRGGSPDPSRKAPAVPHGTANVVHRGSRAGAPGWIPHTAGVFDVLVENNYAEYGVSLCWGNKCRQVVIRGNVARFISDYSFGAEGGENMLFANNISINSTSGGIVSMYWGENLLITGNQILVKHEPINLDYSRFPDPSSYLGSFVRLHHGPSNKEDRYGAGTTFITNNIFLNELTQVTKGIDIQSGRDVTISGNKFVNGRIAKSGEEREGEAKVTVIGNEFISRMPTDMVVVDIGRRTSLAIVRDNVLRREPPVVRGSMAQRDSEKNAVPYFLSADAGDEKAAAARAKKPVPTSAINIEVDGKLNAFVQDNVIVGWKEAFRLTASKEATGACVVTDNLADGVIASGETEGGMKKLIERNIAGK